MGKFSSLPLTTTKKDRHLKKRDKSWRERSFHIRRIEKSLSFNYLHEYLTTPTYEELYALTEEEYLQILDERKEL